MTTTVIALTSCEIVKIEPEIIMDEHESINPLMMSSYKVTHENADDLVEVLYPQKIVKEIDYLTEDSDTLAFIYNFDNGWIVISGDKRGKPIIGQSEKGQIKAKGNHQGIDIWLKSCISDFNNINIDEAKNNIEFWNHVIPKSKRTLANKTTRGWIDETRYWVLRFDYEEVPTKSTNYVIPHLLKTKWGQWMPWNYKCPVGYLNENERRLCQTGCTAVAMAQVIYYMHYFKGKPTGLYHNISCTGYSIDEKNYSVDFARSNYVEDSPRWDQMALCNADSGTDFVGDLMMDVGNRVEMSYSYNGSGAFPSNDGFSYYSLSCKKDDYSVNKVNSNLSNGLPVVIVAYAGKEKAGIWPFKYDVGTKGHTWVIDGKVEQEFFYKKHY